MLPTRKIYGEDKPQLSWRRWNPAIDVFSSYGVLFQRKSTMRWEDVKEINRKALPRRKVLLKPPWGKLHSKPREETPTIWNDDAYLEAQSFIFVLRIQSLQGDGTCYTRKLMMMKHDSPAEDIVDQVEFMDTRCDQFEFRSLDSPQKFLLRVVAHPVA